MQMHTCNISTYKHIPSEIKAILSGDIMPKLTAQRARENLIKL